MARYTRTARGGVKLKSGETVSKAEYQQLQKAVRKANIRRTKALEKRPKEFVRTKSGEFGEETNWYYKRKSARLSKFNTKAGFKKYLASVKAISSGDFERRRDRIYFENYKKALQSSFGNVNTRELREKINKIGIERMNEAFNSGELETDIGYVYDQTADKRYDAIVETIDKIYSEGLYKGRPRKIVRG